MSAVLERSDYRELISDGGGFLDLRSPAEFAKGALPNSVNAPLLNDDERAQVGLCYKHQGQAAAIALGHQLLSGAVKAARMTHWLNFARSHPQGALFCWRGGLRSHIVQQWLAEAGVAYPLVVGGYKALRRFLIDEQARVLATTPLFLLAGRTGCGKTQFLQQLPDTLDLEALAGHRGSAFGGFPSGQPTQLNFENALATKLVGFSAPWLMVEDEGALIGRCALPEVWREAMARASCVVLEKTLEARVTLIFQDYILKKLELWRALEPDAAFEAFSNDLCTALAKIQRRLGGLRYQRIAGHLRAALLAHKNEGHSWGHMRWIAELLCEYYDPMYDYQLEKKAARIVFRGDEAAVRAWILQQKNS